MNLVNKKVVFVMALNCEYPGNVVLSLRCLASKLREDYNITVSWIFPKQDNRKWIDDLRIEHDVYFINSNYGRASKEFKKLLSNIQPDIIHTHFELYDIDVAKAGKSLKLKAKMVWHVHDIMSLSVKGESLGALRYIRRCIIYPLRYHYYGKDAYFISVSPQMAAFTGYYRKHVFSTSPRYSNDELIKLKYPRVETIINGVLDNRLSSVNAVNSTNSPSNVFTFLTFGGNFRGKGIDTIFQACKKLHSEGIKFSLLITQGNDLIANVNAIYGENTPIWLRIINQTEDVASLYGSANCYISASRGETMSLAIAEATFMRLPVIQSDIPGTYWNVSNPSTYLFKLNDSQELYEKMKNVLYENKEELLRNCQITEKTNRDRLGLNIWKDKIISVYKKL